MNLFELFVKIGVDDQASGKLSDLSSKLGNGLKTAAKIGTAAVGAAAAGITALTTAAVNNYAEYEQLIGGVETLYGAKYKTIEEYIERTGAAAEYAEQTFAEYQKRQQAVLDNAANAYKTAGMSANEYMNTVNGFAASLTSSLGEYEWQAANYADMIVSDMADNANKMGTSMDMIQNAYAGFAKQNYTMLDNLKLGYGGTKTEMERLLRDAERMAGYIEGSLDIESFADIADAIHIVQEEMGITGTTALEAGRTISGSVGAMKSAWTNLVTGFADKNADIEKLINNLVETIVGDGTENNLGVVGNILPAVETALGGIVKLIEGAAPKIIEILPGLVKKIAPSLTSAATSLVASLVSVLPNLLQSVITALTDQTSDIIQTVLDVLLEATHALIDNTPVVINAIRSIIDELILWVGEYSNVFGLAAVDLISALCLGIVDSLPQLLNSALAMVEYFAEAIVNAVPKLIDAAVKIVMSLIDFILNDENLNAIIDTALQIILTITDGLAKAIPQLVNAAIQIIEKLCEFFLNPENISMLLDMAFNIIVAVVEGLSKATGELVRGVGKLILSIIDTFKKTDWGSLGRNLVDGFKNGISRAWTSLKTWFKNLFGDLISIAKKILGIASPSKVFKKIGGFTAEGFGAGFEDEFAHVKDDMEDALNFDDASVGINASIRKVGAGAAGMAYGGTSIGNININIDGAKYSDEQSLASAIAQEIQNMTDRRAAVYA